MLRRGHFKNSVVCQTHRKLAEDERCNTPTDRRR